MKVRTHRSQPNLIFASTILAAAMCTSSGMHASTKPSGGTATNSSQAPMKISRKCKATILHESICMVQMILEDVAKNHGNLGNSGASLIKEVTSNTYEITLPQGSHDAVITYEFDAKKDGTVTLISKKESKRNQ